MSEIPKRAGYRIVCKLPEGEPQGLSYFDFGDGTKGILAKISDRIYLIDEEKGTYKEIKPYE